MADDFGLDKALFHLTGACLLFPSNPNWYSNVAYQCSCHDYQHYRKCVHSLAVSMKHGGHRIPAEFQSASIPVAGSKQPAVRGGCFTNDAAPKPAKAKKTKSGFRYIPRK